MTNAIIINERNKTIEMTKKFANAAKRYGTTEYKDLQSARRDYPKFKVVTRSTGKKRNGFKGLTLDCMETYIKEHKTEILTDFYTLCGKDEAGEYIEIEGLRIERASYGEIKSWFLKEFPVFENYTDKINNILGKKIA